MENIVPEENLENKLNYQILFPFPFHEVPKVTVSPHQKRWEDEIANPKDAIAGQRLTETVFEVRKGFVG